MANELNKTQTVGCLMALLRLIVTTPLYYIFLYQVLVHIAATDLIWILFWIYMPAGIGLTLIGEVGLILLKPKDAN